MKTQFLYFREKGSQSFTYSSGAQEFTINGDDNWDPNISADTEVKVTVTSNDETNTNVGSAYTAISAAGQVTTINDAGKSYATNVITIATYSDTTNGYTLEAGDIVTITLIPAQGTEAAFRADRLLSVHANSDTETEVTFKASNGSAADDTVTFTHADDDGVAFRKIAKYFAEAAAGNFVNSGAVISVADRYNNIVAAPLLDAGITKMLIDVA
jgi:hypothetical protein